MAPFSHRYFECPPRSKTLRCLRNRAHGGTSFVDAFAAAEALRATHPADFALLATMPVTFQYINDARQLHHARPTITLEPAAPSGGSSSGNEPCVTAVSYIQSFHAIRHMSSTICLPAFPPCRRGVRFCVHSSIFSG